MFDAFSAYEAGSSSAAARPSPQPIDPFASTVPPNNEVRFGWLSPNSDVHFLSLWYILAAADDDALCYFSLMMMMTQCSILAL